MVAVNDADVFSTSADAPSWVSPLYQKATVGGEVIWSSGGSGSTAFSTGNFAIPPNTWTQVTETFTSPAGATKAELVLIADNGTPGDQWFYSEHDFYVTSVGTNLLSSAQQGNQSTTSWAPNANTCVLSPSTARTHGGNTFSTLMYATNSGSAPTNFDTESSISNVVVSAGPLGFTWTFWVYWIPGNNSDGQSNTGAANNPGAVDASFSLSPIGPEIANAAVESSVLSATIRDTEACSGMEAVLLAITDSDVLASTNTAVSWNGTLSGSDAVAGAEVSTTLASLIDSDESTEAVLTPAYSLLIDAEAASGADAAFSWNASLLSTEIVAGIEAFFFTLKNFLDTDAFTGTDAPSAVTAVTASIAAADAGTGVDSGGSISVLIVDSDMFSGADSAAPASAVLSAGDAGTGVTTSLLTATISDTEVLSADAETGAARIEVFSADSFSGIDAAVVAGTIVRDFDEGTFVNEGSVPPDNSLSDSDSAFGTDAVLLLNTRTVTRQGIAGPVAHPLVQPLTHARTTALVSFNVSQLNVSSFCPPMSWDTVGRESVTASLSFNNNAASTAVATVAFGIVRRISVYARCTWDEQERYAIVKLAGFRTLDAVVSASPVAGFADLFRKSQSAAVAFDTIQRASSISNTSWNTGGHTSAKARFGWNISTGGIYSTATVQWNTQSYIPVVSSAQFSWATAQRSLRAPHIYWNTRKAVVSSSHSCTWKTRAAVVQNASLTWETRSRVTQDTTSAWETRQRPHSLARAAWDTTSRVTNSGAIRHATWNVYLPVSSDSHSCTWNTRKRPSQTHASTWDTAQRRASVKGSAWRDLVRVTRQPLWVMRWNTLGLAVTSDSGLMKWNVTKSSTRTARCGWNTRAPVTRDSHSCTWKTCKRLASDSHSCTWNVTGRTSQTALCTWDEIKTYHILTASQWNTLHDPKSAATMEWNVGMPVSIGERYMAGLSWASAE